MLWSKFHKTCKNHIQYEKRTTNQWRWYHTCSYDLVFWLHFSSHEKNKHHVDCTYDVAQKIFGIAKFLIWFWIYKIFEYRDFFNVLFYSKLNAMKTKLSTDLQQWFYNIYISHSTKYTKFDTHIKIAKWNSDGKYKIEYCTYNSLRKFCLHGCG